MSSSRLTGALEVLLSLPQESRIVCKKSGAEAYGGCPGERGAQRMLVVAGHSSMEKLVHFSALPCTWIALNGLIPGAGRRVGQQCRGGCGDVALHLECREPSMALVRRTAGAVGLFPKSGQMQGKARSKLLAGTVWCQLPG